MKAPLALRKSLLLLLAVLSVVTVSCGRAASIGELRGVAVEDPTPKPEFTLVDTDGNPYDFISETEGRLTLLYFGYTHCPDICPVHLAQIAETLDQLPDVARQTEVVFVSVDPERDTPDVIRAFLDNFDQNFVGLTGSADDLNAAQEAAGVPPAIKEGDGDDYTMQHAGWVIAYAPDGLNHAIYPFGTRQTQWNNDLQVLAEIGQAERG